MASWKFIVTDLDYGPLGELVDVFDVDVNRRINGIDTLAFRVRSENLFFSVLSSQQCYIKAYRNNILQFFGEVYTTDVVGQDDVTTLAVNCLAEGYRMAGMYPSNVTDFVAPTSTDTSIDRRAYLYTAMWRAQFLNSYITIPGTDPPSAEPQVRRPAGLYIPYTFDSKPIYWGSPTEQANRSMADVLAMASNGASGFDWQWIPSDPTPMYSYPNTNFPDTTSIWTSNQHSTGYGPTPGYYYMRISPIATLNFNPGSFKSNVFFEYGMGRQTLQGYRFTSTKENLSNVFVFSSVNSVTRTLNSTSIDTWGRRDVRQVTDVPYDQLLANQILTYRKTPRRRVEIQPRRTLEASTDPPQFDTDFVLGDTFNVRLAAANAGLLVNGIVRLYAINFTLGDGKAETVKLTIEEQ